MPLCRQRLRTRQQMANVVPAGLVEVPLRAALTVLTLLLLAGCALEPAAVPPPPSTATAAAQTPQVWGSRGPLSRRQADRVLAQLTRETVNADILARHIAIEQAVAGNRVYAGNQVRVLRDGFETFPAVFAAIKGAKHTLWLEYYIFEDVTCDGVRLSDALLERHAAGVQVAVLYDGIGSLGTPREVFERLRAAGIEVRAFNPPNPLEAHGHWSLNDRDHRKILVADGRLGIIGGINLSSTYQSSTPGSAPVPSGDHKTGTVEYWRDTDVQIEGPAVADLARLFSRHWVDQGGEPLETAAPPAGEQAAGQLVRILGSTPGAFAPRYYATLLSSIRIAQERIRVSAAYFVPTHQEKRLLIRAARRGVDVQLLLPAHSDSAAALAVQRSTYEELLAAGIKIYERDHVILHSKCVVVDGVWSVLGSSNFDHRSVLFNDEVDAVILGRPAAQALEQLFDEDMQAAHRVELSTWRQRPFGERFREWIYRTMTGVL